MDFFLSSGSPPCQRSTTTSSLPASRSLCSSIQPTGTSIIPSLYPHIPQLPFPFLGIFHNPFLNSFLNFRQPPLCSSEQIPRIGPSSEQARKLVRSPNVPPSISGSSTTTGQPPLYASEQISGLGLSSEQLRQITPSTVNVPPSMYGSSTITGQSTLYASEQIPGLGLCSEQLRNLAPSITAAPSIHGSSSTSGQLHLCSLEHIRKLVSSPNVPPSISESPTTTTQSTLEQIPGLGLSAEQLRKLASSTMAAPTVNRSSTMSINGQPNSTLNLFDQESVFRVNHAEELNPLIPELISKVSAFNRFRSATTRSSIDSGETNETSLLNPHIYLNGEDATAKKSIPCHPSIRFPTSLTFLDQNLLSFHKKISSSICTSTSSAGSSVQSSTLFQVIPLDTYFKF